MGIDELDNAIGNTQEGILVSASNYVNVGTQISPNTIANNNEGIGIINGATNVKIASNSIYENRVGVYKTGNVLAEILTNSIYCNADNSIFNGSTLAKPIVP